LNQCATEKFCQNPKNARLIADFLTKLHQVSLADLHGTNVHPVHTRSYWETLYASVRDKVFPLLNQKLQCQITKTYVTFLSEWPSAAKQKILIHGDLSSSNLIYDPDKNCLSGVIDFTDAQIEDPAFDFAGVYWQFGPEFTKQVLALYASDQSIDSLFKRVRTFYGLQPAFHELLYSVEQRKPIDGGLLQRFSELYGLSFH
jgi:Predicted aminoglycoside phosphotransferase